MNFVEIKPCDISNGYGVRVSLFVAGCRNQCDGCFNPETWSFEAGKPFTEDTEKCVFEMLDHPYIAGISILGGEPFEPENQYSLVEFLKRYKKRFPDKDVWVYTGYRYEQLLYSDDAPRCEFTDEMLSYVDYLVDGPFIKELYNITLEYRGSSNQRVINMNYTRKNGRLFLEY